MHRQITVRYMTEWKNYSIYWNKNRNGKDMLNYIWGSMILIGIIYGSLTGRMEAVTNAALDSSREAVSLCITMIGVMALWMGLMEIAEKTGLIEKWTKAISPFVSFMFPDIPKDHMARKYISTNIIANVLGLGWACTPAGLKAMEELAKLEAQRGNPEYLQNGGGRRTRSGMTPEKGSGKGAPAIGRKRTASREMCVFLILNISSLQLIPVNMIAYRSQYGSSNPAVIIAPAILATAVSTLAAVIYCKIKEKLERKS